MTALGSPLVDAARPGQAGGSAAAGDPPAAPSTVLEVRHETEYRYDSPVSLAHHRAHLRPLEDGFQRLTAHTLEIEPVPGFRRDGVDALGNPHTHFSIAQPHSALRVCAASVLQVSPRFDVLQPGAGPAWDALARGLRYVAGATLEPAVEFLAPSPYVPRLPELRAYALPSFAPGCPVAAGALHLMQRLHADFRYDSQSTQVDTPLAQAFAQRRGVCQDFAHLLIGCLRMLGLPARYVSGYLLTEPADAAEGAAPMLGADASHAWVQVWCPGTPGVPHGPLAGRSAGWLSLDPTNNLVPRTGHVRLALGRDYSDVTPLRGVIRGGGRHRLAVAVRTRVVPPPPDPAASVARSLHKP
ncbi:MAG: transglutaminase family protein [Rubrivivax sp.]|nr:transglutaminase family protein [Rubrivivax sp.]